MAEVVAQKFWVKVSSKEIETLIRSIVPDEMCDFDLIEVQTTMDGHLIETVTFGLSYNMLAKEGDMEGSALGDHLREDM